MTTRRFPARGVAVLAGTAALALCGVVPAAGAPQAGQITSYAVTSEAQPDGSLTATVNLAYAGSGGPGPTLVLPLRDEVDGDASHWRRLDVRDLTLRSSTGAPADTTVDRSDAALTIHVAPQGNISGTQMYVVSYVVTGVVASSAADGAVVRWPVLAPEHADQIRGLTATVKGPGTISSLFCRAGADNCSLSVNQSAQQGEFEQNELPAQQGWRIGATFPAGSFAQAPAPELVARNGERPGWLLPAGIAAAVVVLAGLLALLLRRRSKQSNAPARAVGETTTQRPGDRDDGSTAAREEDRPVGESTPVAESDDRTDGATRAGEPDGR